MALEMWVFQRVFLVILALLGIAAVWVLFRAATAHGLLWGLKRLLVLVAGVALLFAGAWGWVRFKARIPRGITVSSVEASYGAVLARLRALAGEHDLENVPSLDENLLGPEMKDLFAPPEILQASFVVPGRRIVMAYERPGLRGPRGHWSATFPDVDQTILARGWVSLGGTSVDTIEYLEPARDATGSEVTVQLTLRLDSLRDARRQ